MDTPAPNTIAVGLESWATDDLLAEVLRRSAGDKSALDRIQATTMRTLLNHADGKIATERKAV
jgi:hypothetical protein